MKLLKKLLCLSFICVPVFLYAQNGIQWTDGMTWDQIKAKAKAENKFIFVDAYATWCGPCKKMDKEVYPSTKVGGVLNPKFVSVRIQMDQTKKDNDQVKSWYSV